MALAWALEPPTASAPSSDGNRLRLAARGIEGICEQAGLGERDVQRVVEHAPQSRLHLVVVGNGIDEKLSVCRGRKEFLHGSSLTRTARRRRRLRSSRQSHSARCTSSIGESHEPRAPSPRRVEIVGSAMASGPLVSSDAGSSASHPTCSATASSSILTESVDGTWALSGDGSSMRAQSPPTTRTQPTTGRLRYRSSVWLTRRIPRASSSHEHRNEI